MHGSKTLIVAVTVLVTLLAIELWGQQAGAPAASPAAQFRFQVSAWGMQGTQGAYIVDTATGQVWLSTNGGSPKAIGTVGGRQGRNN